MTLDKFESISNVSLRTYNRAVYLTNLNKSLGESMAKEYIESFDSGERKQIFIMLTWIKQKGQEEVMKWVNKQVEVSNGIA